jgi:hypothetical protein
MPAGAINRELDRLDGQRAEVNKEFISAGRGAETFEETCRKDDPLALRFREISDRQAALRAEISRRCGPSAPSRLPRGVGPI